MKSNSQEYFSYLKTPVKSVSLNLRTCHKAKYGRNLGKYYEQITCNYITPFWTFISLFRQHQTNIYNFASKFKDIKESHLWEIRIFQVKIDYITYDYITYDYKTPFWTFISLFQQLHKTYVLKFAPKDTFQFVLLILPYILKNIIVS